jgi:hypothetical protein
MQALNVLVLLRPMSMHVQLATWMSVVMITYLHVQCIALRASALGMAHAERAINAIKPRNRFRHD